MRKLAPHPAPRPASSAPFSAVCSDPTSASMVLLVVGLLLAGLRQGPQLREGARQVLGRGGSPAQPPATASPGSRDGSTNVFAETWRAARAPAGQPRSAARRSRRASSRRGRIAANPKSRAGPRTPARDRTRIRQGRIAQGDHSADVSARRRTVRKKHVACATCARQENERRPAAGGIRVAPSPFCTGDPAARYRKNRLGSLRARYATSAVPAFTCEKNRRSPVGDAAPASKVGARPRPETPVPGIKAEVVRSPAACRSVRVPSGIWRRPCSPRSSVLRRP